MRGSARKQYARIHTGKHVPNKEEARELRRLMQKSGLTEGELRKEKVYRVKLANARALSQSGTGNNAYRLEMRKFRKCAAFELGTHINDPKVVQRARLRYSEYHRSLRNW